MQYQALTGEWQLRQADSEEWLPARVPGVVHTDLRAAERIPNPLVGDNEKRVQWVAETDWEHRRIFTVEASLLAHQHVFLTVAGRQARRFG